MRRPAAIAAAAVALAAPAAGCGGSDDDGVGSPPRGAPPAEKTRVRVVEGLERGRFDPERIYRALAPGVVTVVAESDGLLDRGAGLGSGFVLDGDGYVVTNAHVIRSDPPRLERADDVYVELADGNRVEARVVGDDLFSDVALLRVDPTGLTLTPLRLGSSSRLRVGEPVAAIGSPFNESQSLSVGVISALDRSIDSLTSFKIGDAIQTDAAINHGNSGGPLIGARGRVIGINAQIQSTGGGGEGVGFAIPVDTVRRSLSQLREHGRVSYAFVGVTTQDLYPQLARRLGFSVARGALVAGVEGGSPADDAGIEAGKDKVEFQGRPGIPEGGDAIVAIAGRPVRGSSDVSDAVAALRPGQRVRLDLVRGSDRRSVTVELGEREPKPASR
ncbi:MAG TPA: trypsin-like peptidase domain-containing protein [Thermoleophilaceae bacterium]|jgi:S1-C subfamily serine protease